MADIDIQRKSPGAWIWIFGLVVLGLLIWALGAALDDEDVEEPVAGVTEPSHAAPAPGPGEIPASVQRYLMSCAPNEPEAMGLDHTYTSACIQQLVDGIGAVVQDPGLSRIADLQPQMETARPKAQELAQSSSESTGHAGMTREAFLSIATVLDAIQDAHYPSLDSQAAQLGETARDLQAGRNLLDQREPVQRFFQQAGDLLNGMAMGPAAGA